MRAREFYLRPGQNNLSAYAIHTLHGRERKHMPIPETGQKRARLATGAAAAAGHCHQTVTLP